MDSLYYLFIFIRSDPMNPVLYNLLQKYQYWLHKDLAINNRSIKKLINELNLLEDHPYKATIISKLKKLRLFRGTKNMERIYQSKVIDQKETEKIRIMASSVHNYPSFILGKYYCNSIDFWNGHINYYNRTFQSDFMNDWMHLFIEYYLKHEK